MWFNKKFKVRREQIFNFADKNNAIHEFAEKSILIDDNIHWWVLSNDDILRKPFILELKDWYEI